MFCGRRYAAYAYINAVYIRTLNGVHSTGKKTPILCVCTAECECIFEVGRQAVSVPSKYYRTDLTIAQNRPYNERSRDSDSLL